MSERHGVDDLAAFISDCDSPARVMVYLMEQSTSKFCCCLVSRSLGRQRVGQINTFIVPRKVVFPAKMEEVTRHLSLPVIGTLSCHYGPTQVISGAGDPLSQGLLRLTPVAFPRLHHWRKKQETANDLLPVGGNKEEEASGKVPLSCGSPPIHQMRKPFPFKRTTSMIFFSFINLCLC
jgi:hypothetical protein